MDQFKLDLIAHLSEFVTENRFKQFKRVLAERTRHISVILEDIYQSQNASAVIRTCDCAGIQDVHIVEQWNEFEINRDVTLGSNQWLNLKYYNQSIDNIGDAVRELKNNGYRIVATSPHADGKTPESFDIDSGRAAIMFGSEVKGLSDRAMELADEFIRIPMVGFTESYNISVSAAIVLYQLRGRLNRSDLTWRISEEERADLLLNWLRISIKMSEKIERHFRQDYDKTF